MAPLPPKLDEALKTGRPIADIAREMGKTVAALERQIERATGCRSRQLRTGKPSTQGRPLSGRSTRQLVLRLTPEEHALLERSLSEGYALPAGAKTDGAALLAFLAHAWQAREAVGHRRKQPRKTPPRRLDLPPEQPAAVIAKATRVRESFAKHQPREDRTPSPVPRFQYAARRDELDLEAGQRFRHGRFGLGVLLAWDATGPRVKLHLRFPEPVGVRVVLASRCTRAP